VIQIAFTAALGLLLGSGVASAANPGAPAVFEGDAEANVVSLILISEDRNLDFGRIIAPQMGIQTFMLPTDGGPIVVGGGGSGGQAIGGHEPGQYDITGTPGQPYTLTMAADGCTDPLLQLAGINNDAPVPTILNQLDIMVGGTLTVSAGIQPNRTYQCNYSITAVYP
jgi:hypothetical protein